MNCNETTTTTDNNYNISSTLQNIPGSKIVMTCDEFTALIEEIRRLDEGVQALINTTLNSSMVADTPPPYLTSKQSTKNINFRITHRTGPIRVDKLTHKFRQTSKPILDLMSVTHLQIEDLSSLITLVYITSGIIYSTDESKKINLTEEFNMTPSDADIFDRIRLLRSDKTECDLSSESVSVKDVNVETDESSIDVCVANGIPSNLQFQKEDIAKFIISNMLIPTHVVESLDGVEDKRYENTEAGVEEFIKDLTKFGYVGRISILNKCFGSTYILKECHLNEQVSKRIVDYVKSNNIMSEISDTRLRKIISDVFNLTCFRPRMFFKVSNEIAKVLGIPQIEPAQSYTYTTLKNLETSFKKILEYKKNKASKELNEKQRVETFINCLPPNYLPNTEKLSLKTIINYIIREIE